MRQSPYIDIGKSVLFALGITVSWLTIAGVLGIVGAFVLGRAGFWAGSILGIFIGYLFWFSKVIND